MTNDQKKSLIQSYITAYNRFDIDAMISVVHPNLVFKNVVNGQVNAKTQGIEEFRVLATESKTLFTARTQTVNSYTFTNDVVTIDIVFEGELAVDLPGGQRSGDVVQLRGKSEFHFKDNKLHRITDYS